MPHMQALFITWQVALDCALKRIYNPNMDTTELNNRGTEQATCKEHVGRNPSLVYVRGEEQ